MNKTASAYLKINDNLFYKLTDGKCEAVNTVKESYKSTKSLPSGYVKDVKVITEVEYEEAKKSIGL